jgi:hypothetical protein
MTAINADDLLVVYVSENVQERDQAMQRLIEDAWKRGWADAHKALLGDLPPKDDPRWQHRLEEAEMGLA